MKTKLRSLRRKNNLCFYQRTYAFTECEICRRSTANFSLFSPPQNKLQIPSFIKFPYVGDVKFICSFCLYNYRAIPIEFSKFDMSKEIPCERYIIYYFFCFLPAQCKDCGLSAHTKYMFDYMQNNYDHKNIHQKTIESDYYCDKCMIAVLKHFRKECTDYPLIIEPYEPY